MRETPKAGMKPRPIVLDYVLLIALILGSGSGCSSVHTANEDSEIVQLVADYPGYTTINEAVAAADVILTGRFISAREELLYADVDPNAGSPETNPQFGLELTESELDVLSVPIIVSTVATDRVLKGAVLPGDIIEISQTGGQKNGVVYRDPSSVLLADVESDTFLLFLIDYDGRHPYTPINTQVGTWEVEGDLVLPVIEPAPFMIGSIQELQGIIDKMS